MKRSCTAGHFAVQDNIKKIKWCITWNNETLLPEKGEQLLCTSHPHKLQHQLYSSQSVLSLCGQFVKTKYITDFMHRYFRTPILRNQRAPLLLTEQPFTPRQQHNTMKTASVLVSYYCGRYRKRNRSKLCACKPKCLQRTLTSRLAITTSSF